VLQGVPFEQRQGDQTDDYEAAETDGRHAKRLSGRGVHTATAWRRCC
jgi:hypothetical protein